MLLDKTLINYVLLNFWITENYNELKKICKKITRGQQCDDLLQMCVEQFLKSKRVPEVPDSQKLFFFARIVRNNYNSTTSPYYHQYGKFKYDEIENIEIPYLSYEEPIINLDWVKEQIEKDKKDGDWYYSRLFEIYIEQGCSVTKTSQITTIPINSVSRDLNKYRKQLNKLRDKVLKEI